MSSHRQKLVLLPPNRVWRTYPGGRTLERLAGKPDPQDSNFAEDWIGSLTESKIPGREHLREGVSQVVVGDVTRDFRQLIDSDPEYFLGADHIAKHGRSLMLLVKFLDSAIRLHFQCHPSREFARRVLNSPSGKTEAYHILAVRPEVPAPYIYMGFQHPPEPAQLKRWIETQDVAAMERCFEKIPVQPGDTFLIPGGFPHALGEGVLMVEIQEPTDFAVRYEFERAGYVLPQPARFMGRDVDFGLSMMDFNRYPLDVIDRTLRGRPRRVRALGPNSWQDQLLGPDQTPCFRVLKTHLREPVEKAESGCFIAIVTAGACTIETAGERRQLRQYDKYFSPAGLGPVRLIPEPACELLECYPPA
ncbi:MAG: class I mannose-6-phosphate isomerase [Opitutae bacterium]|nr:class I mannose-6-phosphate isomerase [Opitutae bacterium]